MSILTRKKLNFYRFLSVKLTDNDLYPHVRYGEIFTLEEIKDFWQKTIKAILEKKASQKLGLYIHIPFCRQKCSFCFCDSYVPFSYSEVETYLVLLKREINIFKEIFKPVSFTSVYFGGGSPACLKNKDLENLFHFIYQNFMISPHSQIMFEGTSTDLTKDVLSLLVKNGVNRLTIGAQSLDSKVIKLIRRPQTKERFIMVYRLARKLGIPYINIDLIAGLEGQSVPSFISDLETVLELGADMVHVSGFTPLSHTSFCKEGKRFSLEQKRNRNIMIAESKRIKTSFFSEITSDEQGLSEEAANTQEKDAREQNSSILGIGYSAQSHAFGQVWYEHPCVLALNSMPNYKKLPIFRGVRSNLDEEMRTFIFNNIQKGFSRTFFYQLFKKDAFLVFKPEILELIKIGKLKSEGDRIVSQIKHTKEFLLLSKLFYSKDRLKAILQKHKDEYREDKDYRKKFELLIADTE
jgi:oxygen-independent coproporphyrinogen-3 oxidase